VFFRDIITFLVKLTKQAHALIKPTFGMSYGLIKQKWFSKLETAYPGLSQMN